MTMRIVALSFSTFSSMNPLIIRIGVRVSGREGEGVGGWRRCEGGGGGVRGRGKDGWGDGEGCRRKDDRMRGGRDVWESRRCGVVEAM